MDNNRAKTKHANIDQGLSIDETMTNELNEFEVREIDLLKYKHEQDTIALKKEYSDQLDFVNNRVSASRATRW